MIRRFNTLFHRLRGVLLLACGLLSLSVLASAKEGNAYKIDPAQSGFLVNTGVAGLFKKFGMPLTLEVREYSGEIRFDPGNPAASSVKVHVAAHSVALKTQVIEHDRMNIEMRTHEKVLESEKYPDIDYASDRVKVWKTGANTYEADVDGTLSLHGKSRQLPLRATLTLRGNRLEAAGEVTLSQKEFGIKTYGYEGGALRVADAVKVSFNLVAVR